MNRRTNRLLRDYVDLVARSAEAGHMSIYAAACRLHCAGVPIETALRKLAGRTA
jgi:hypothetical protein